MLARRYVEHQKICRVIIIFRCFFYLAKESKINNTFLYIFGVIITEPEPMSVNTLLYLRSWCLSRQRHSYSFSLTTTKTTTTTTKTKKKARMLVAGCVSSGSEYVYFRRFLLWFSNKEFFRQSKFDFN